MGVALREMGSFPWEGEIRIRGPFPPRFLAAPLVPTHWAKTEKVRIEAVSCSVALDMLFQAEHQSFVTFTDLPLTRRLVAEYPFSPPLPTT